MIRGLRLATLVAGFLCLFLSLSAPAAPSVRPQFKPWESFDFRSKEITPEELKDLTLTEMKYLRGLVFARHGRVFGEPLIQNYVKTLSWYKPDPKYHVSNLNDTERKNMDAIKAAEFKKHTFIEPGDLKFFRDRLFTEADLGTHTAPDWWIMRAEVEAIHGKRFDDQPWLQAFFEERYWYQPNPNYDPKALSEIERKNLATIIRAQKRQRGVALGPGEMAEFMDKPLPETLLQGLSLYELRLLRNEVYARRGRRFKMDWLQAYFHDQPWYRPNPKFRDADLTPVEAQNLATIVKRERLLHEQISLRPVAERDLDGLFLEDIRKLRYEIYARHGKVFPTHWLNSYFSTFEWYKPNPRYSDRLLTPVERKNAAMLLAYERDLEKVMSSSAA